MTNMKSEKEELIEKFRDLFDDLLDHYEEYTEDEKAQIKGIFLQASDLNAILDKYDIEKKLNWPDYLTAFDRYFI